ncbi:MAG: low molecular weight phosphotyrosine protein phosphatase [Reyranella sp.]|nr:low molecular weight phosphotyrosine protein phosphatase [Reyranella sp.]
MTVTTTIDILFVCTGNTCRSPMAAGVMRSLVRNAGLEHAFEIDSAGTTVRVAGQPASLLAVEAAARRGHDIAGHRSRPLTADDLARATHPLAMAEAHLAAMRALAPSGLTGRSRMLTAQDIVDPYDGTAQDYQRALDLIEAGCLRLFGELRQAGSK